MEAVVLTIQDRPMPAIVRPQKEPRVGRNMALLAKLVPNGAPLFDVPKGKMESIRNSAWRLGISIRIRRMVDASGKPINTYAIQRRT